MSADTRTEADNASVAPLTLTLSDAAKEMGVSSDTIMRWVEEGHLPVFVPPGHDFANTKPGPRGYRLWRADWEAFKRRQTFVGGLPIVAPPPRALSPIGREIAVRRRFPR